MRNHQCSIRTEILTALEQAEQADRRRCRPADLGDDEKDFALQSAALGDADNAFRDAGKKSGAGKAAKSRGGRSQVRRNQAAVDLFE